MSKFHINKHGVPAPCKAREGNCPLGGDDLHFDTAENAQEYADKLNESQHGILPSTRVEMAKGQYMGYYYDLSEHAHENMKEAADPFLTRDNFKSVFDSGFKDGDIEVEYEYNFMGNPPENFNGTLSKVSGDTYRATGTLSEYSYEERDFDSKEEFDSYLEGDPDEVHKVDLTFSADELQSSAENSKSFYEGWKVNKQQASPAMMKEVFHLMKK